MEIDWKRAARSWWATEFSGDMPVAGSRRISSWSSWSTDGGLGRARRRGGYRMAPNLLALRINSSSSSLVDRGRGRVVIEISFSKEDERG